MKIEIEIDDSIAQDALDNAWETGIAYWMNEDATDVEVQNSEGYGKDGVDVSQWKHLKVTFKCDHDGKGVKDYEVTAQKMLEALPAFHKAHSHLTAEQYLSGEYNGDAMSDDAWFQFAAFGEVVYG